MEQNNRTCQLKKPFLFMGTEYTDSVSLVSAFVRHWDMAYSVFLRGDLDQFFTEYMEPPAAEDPYTDIAACSAKIWQAKEDIYPDIIFSEVLRRIAPDHIAVPNTSEVGGTLYTKREFAQKLIDLRYSDSGLPGWDRRHYNREGMHWKLYLEELCRHFGSFHEGKTVSADDLGSVIQNVVKNTDTLYLSGDGFGGQLFDNWSEVFECLKGSWKNSDEWDDEKKRSRICQILDNKSYQEAVKNWIPVEPDEEIRKKLKELIELRDAFDASKEPALSEEDLRAEDWSREMFSWFHGFVRMRTWVDPQTAKAEITSRIKRIEQEKQHLLEYQAYREKVDRADHLAAGLLGFNDPSELFSEYEDVQGLLMKTGVTHALGNIERFLLYLMEYRDGKRPTAEQLADRWEQLTDVKDSPDGVRRMLTGFYTGLCPDDYDPALADVIFEKTKGRSEYEALLLDGIGACLQLFSEQADFLRDHKQAVVYYAKKLTDLRKHTADAGRMQSGESWQRACDAIWRIHVPEEIHDTLADQTARPLVAELREKLDRSEYEPEADELEVADRFPAFLKLYKDYCEKRDSYRDKITCLENDIRKAHFDCECARKNARYAFATDFITAYVCYVDAYEGKIKKLRELLAEGERLLGEYSFEEERERLDEAFEPVAETVRKKREAEAERLRKQQEREAEAYRRKQELEDRKRKQKEEHERKQREREIRKQERQAKRRKMIKKLRSCIPGPKTLAIIFTTLTFFCGIGYVLCGPVYFGIPLYFGKHFGYEEIKIAPFVKTIREKAFEGADKITSMELPDKVEQIGADAFFGCTALESIHLNSYLYENYEDAVSDSAFPDSVQLSVNVPYNFLSPDTAGSIISGDEETAYEVIRKVIGAIPYTRQYGSVFSGDDREEITWLNVDENTEELEITGLDTEEDNIAIEFAVKKRLQYGDYTAMYQLDFAQYDKWQADFNFQSEQFDPNNICGHYSYSKDGEPEFAIERHVGSSFYVVSDYASDPVGGKSMLVNHSSAPEHFARLITPQKGEEDAYVFAEEDIVGIDLEEDTLYWKNKPVYRVAEADPIEEQKVSDLEGVWKGSYVTGGEEHGCTFVFMPMKNNDLHGLMVFAHNGDSGSYILDADYSANNRTVGIRGVQWVNERSDYGFLDITLNLNKKKNTLSNNEYELKAKRVTTEDSDLNQ